MKNLTLRYSITQFTYWAASSGAAVFATTYLLNQGVPSAMVGLMLALAGLMSCLTQPLLAAFVDRAERFLLIKILILFSALCCICFSLQLVNGLPLMLTAILYMVGGHSAARARDIYAHHYGRMDFEIAWETATTVIDELTAFCEEYLS